MQGRIWTISEGDLCFFPPGVVFDRQVIEKLKIHYIEIKWNCSDDTLKVRNCYPIGGITLSDSERLKSNLQMLFCLSQSYIPDCSELTLHYVRDIWIQFLTDSTHAVREFPVHTADPVIAKAMDYFNSHLHTVVNMPDAAAYCGLSPFQFTKKFSQVIGISPMTYLTNLRIEKAKKLLSKTEIPVSRIAVMCGYENPFYFSKRFRTVTGISPQHYRNSLKTV